MAKKIKVYTDAQLIRKTRFIRRLTDIKFRKASKHNIGKEIFLETEEGRIRALVYNMESSEKLPLFINLHGGGFILGAPEMDDPYMPRIAEKANVKILNIDYGLAPDHPFPKALNQCYAVAKYAKTHPDKFGIDPERIAVGGQSAGGNLTAAICLLDNERKLLNLKAAVLDYPPLDIYTDAADKTRPKGALPVFLSRIFDPCYLNDREGRKNPLISPVFASIDQLKRFPPTLIITASRDSLCAEAEKFKDKLIEANVAVTYKCFDALHGFNLKPGPEADESWQMIADHLKLYLRQ